MVGVFPVDHAHRCLLLMRLGINVFILNIISVSLAF